MNYEWGEEDILITISICRMFNTAGKIHASQNGFKVSTFNAYTYNKLIICGTNYSF